MMITGYYAFEAAHRLHDPSCDSEANRRLFGPCGTMHGHTYRIEVTLRGESLKHGMFVNFTVVDEIVKTHVVGLLDHRTIDDIPYFFDHPSTAEQIAVWIWWELAERFAQRTDARLSEVKVFEGEHFSATVSERDFAS